MSEQMGERCSCHVDSFLRITFCPTHQANRELVDVLRIKLAAAEAFKDAWETVYKGMTLAEVEAQQAEMRTELSALREDKERLVKTLTLWMERGCLYTELERYLKDQAIDATRADDLKPGDILKGSLPQ